jgi:hypothetical protein
MDVWTKCFVPELQISCLFLFCHLAISSLFRYPILNFDCSCSTVLSLLIARQQHIISRQIATAVLGRQQALNRSRVLGNGNAALGSTYDIISRHRCSLIVLHPESFLSHRKGLHAIRSELAHTMATCPRGSPMESGPAFDIGHEREFYKYTRSAP